MTKIVALEIDRAVDLSAFSSLLFQAGVIHRISESGNLQILFVRSEEEKTAVQAIYQRYVEGDLQLPQVDSRQIEPRSMLPNILTKLMKTPLVVVILCLNVMFFPITMGSEVGEFNFWFQTFTFLEFKLVGNELYFASVEYTLSTHQYWRLLTPMFLHFGWLHIVFNLLWVWEIGKRIEKHSGASVLLMVVLASSLGANFMQYWLAGAGLFGGMSGVVFGLLGFALCWHFYMRASYFGLPKGIYIFMLGYLVLGFTGAIDLWGLGSLANGAHLGGLLAGLGIGGVTVCIQFISDGTRNSTS